MLETFLGSKDVNVISQVGIGDPSTPHIPQIRRQALHVCNFVMGRLPEHSIKTDEVHRIQNTFRLRSLLLRSLQESGEWEDLVDGIETGINVTFTPLAGSVGLKKTTVDDLLLQVHCIGESLCGTAGACTLPCGAPQTCLTDLPS